MGLDLAVLVRCYRIVKGTKSESKSQPLATVPERVTGCYRIVKGTYFEGKSQQYDQVDLVYLILRSQVIHQREKLLVIDGR